MADIWFDFVRSFSGVKFVGKKTSISSLFELYKSQENLKNGLNMIEFLQVFNTARENIILDKYFVNNYITSIRNIFPEIGARKKHIL